MSQINEENRMEQQLRVIFEMLNVLKSGREHFNRPGELVRRGRYVLNQAPGSYNLIGITIQAQDALAAVNWDAKAAKAIKLQRDHFQAFSKFVGLVMDSEFEFDEFYKRYKDHGRCILVTAKQNPPKVAGYGYGDDAIYTNKDIRLFDEPIDTSSSIATSMSKESLKKYRAANRVPTDLLVRNIRAIKMVEKDGMNLRLVEEFQNDKDVVLAAIKNCKYAFQFASDELQKDESVYSLVEKDDSYYFHMVDPRNGERYAIPLLGRTDPKYYYQYVYNMRLKESSPDTFEKMLRWD